MTRLYAVYDSKYEKYVKFKGNSTYLSKPTRNFYEACTSRAMLALSRCMAAEAVIGRDRFTLEVRNSDDAEKEGQG